MLARFNGDVAQLASALMTCTLIERSQVRAPASSNTFQRPRLDRLTNVINCVGVANSYCQPNIHFMLNDPDWLKNTLAEPLENVQLFNPAQTKYDAKKSYTHHNYGDLHITPPCVFHQDSAYVFAQVRRLKPFYYYYCDKWVNSMGQQKVNLASDGGKLSTRPCSKKVLDPLNRFQLG